MKKHFESNSKHLLLVSEFNIKMLPGYWCFRQWSQNLETVWGRGLFPGRKSCSTEGCWDSFIPGQGHRTGKLDCENYNQVRRHIRRSSAPRSGWESRALCFPSMRLVVACRSSLDWQRYHQYSEQAVAARARQGFQKGHWQWSYNSLWDPYPQAWSVQWVLAILHFVMQVRWLCDLQFFVMLVNFHGFQGSLCNTFRMNY